MPIPPVRRYRHAAFQARHSATALVDQLSLADHSDSPSSRGRPILTTSLRSWGISHYYCGRKYAKMQKAPPHKPFLPLPLAPGIQLIIDIRDWRRTRCKVPSYVRRRVSAATRSWSTRPHNCVKSTGWRSAAAHPGTASRMLYEPRDAPRSPRACARLAAAPCGRGTAVDR